MHVPFLIADAPDEYLQHQARLLLLRNVVVGWHAAARSICRFLDKTCCPSTMQSTLQIDVSPP